MADNNFYNDQELRAMCIAHAIKLLDIPEYRARGETNTTNICNVTNELTNIIKYGSVKTPTQEELNTQPATFA